MSRPRQSGTRFDKTGGENDIPRSLGTVFRALRFGLGKSQEEMRTHLESTPSDFRLPSPRTKSKLSNPAAKISLWELGRENVSFAMQHRYATIAGTYTGVLHLVSLFIARWRDAESELDETKRNQLLNENEKIAEGLIALANFVLLENARLIPHGMATNRQGDQDLTRILELIDAYCAGAGTRRRTSDAIV